MPHSTQHEVHEPDARENTPAIQESSARSNGFGNVYKGKGQQPSHALNRLGPYEVDGTPVQQRSTALSSQYEILELSPMLSEAKTNLEAALQKYNHLYWMCHSITHRISAMPEAQDLQMVEAAQEALAKSLLAAAPEPLPYPEFIQLIEEEGLTWLLEYVDQIDRTANFAVAPTAEPNKKRYKVGRPRGKVLKEAQNDDLVRRLCCLHLDEVGFYLQVNGQHRDPWMCWPPNADEDVDVDVE